MVDGENQLRVATAVTDNALTTRAIQSVAQEGEAAGPRIPTASRGATLGVTGQQTTHSAMAEPVAPSYRPSKTFTSSSFRTESVLGMNAVIKCNVITRRTGER